MEKFIELYGIDPFYRKEKRKTLSTHMCVRCKYGATAQLVVFFVFFFCTTVSAGT